jgi:uncharacterized delta-60 repeat protein
MSKYLTFVLVVLVTNLLQAQPGTPDPSFGAGGKVYTPFFRTPTDQAQAMAIQSDGKIVIAGHLYIDGNYRFLVARYNTDGTPDTSFDGDGHVITSFGGDTEVAHAVAIQPDGKIIVAGESAGSMAVARYNSTGILDTSFDTDGKVMGVNGRAKSIALIPDNKIIVAGESGNFVLVCYTGTGALDGSFGSGGLVETDMGGFEVMGGIVYSADRLTVAGTSLNPSTSNGSFALARYTLTGALDSGFGDAGSGKAIHSYAFLYPTNYANAIALQPDGKIVITGYSGNNDDNVRYLSVARFTATGGRDTGFGLGGLDGSRVFLANVDYRLGQGFAVTTQTVGANDVRILAAGVAGNKFTVARFTSTGELDSDFATNGNTQQIDFGTGSDEAHGIALDANGKIVAAGLTTGAFDVTDIALARLDALGNLDNTFGNGGTAVQDIGATFQVINTNDYATALAVQSDGKLVAVGQTGDDFYSGFALARYTPDGALDLTFGKNGKIVTAFVDPYNGANAVAIQTDGKILLAGSVDDNSSVSFALARYNPDGTLDVSFGLGGLAKASLPEVSPLAPSLAIQTDGKIVLAAADDVYFALVRFHPDGALDTGFGEQGNGTVLTEIGADSRLFSKGVLIGPTGKIYMAGHEEENDKLILARYNSDGTLDQTFGTNHGYTIHPFNNVEVSGMALQGQKLIVGGNIDGELSVFRFNLDGTLDTSFDENGFLTIGDISSHDGGVEVLPDGRIILAGSSFWNGTQTVVVARFMPNGLPDESFDGDSDGNGFVFLDMENQIAAVKAAGNRIYLAGEANGDFAVLALKNSDAGVSISQEPIPASVTVCQGGNASTFIKASGDGLSYEWYKGAPNLTSGVKVTGQTSSTLVLSNLQTVGTETYYARVTGQGGVEDWSSGFTVQILASPVVNFSMGNPAPLTVVQNTANVTLTLSGCSGGTFFWTGSNNTSGNTATFQVPTSVVTTLVYSATCSLGSCSSFPASATVVVTTPSVVAGNFEGFLSTVNCQEMRGWVWDRSKPNTQLLVEFFADGTPIGAIEAKNFRQDLKDAGKGNGEHGYVFPTPDAAKTGIARSISAKVKDSNYVLKGSPINLTCPASNTVVNLPPVPASTGPLSATVGAVFSTILAAFTDPESQPLTYTLNGLPNGLQFATITREISGTPTVTGMFLLSYGANDGRQTATTSLTMVVAPAFDTPPPVVTGSFEGFLDKVECVSIRGWVWDRNKPNTPLMVQFFANGVAIGTAEANIYRVDLKNAGKGNGAHAYSFTTPVGLKDNVSRQISAKVLGSSYVLKESGKPLACSPVLNARIAAEISQPLQLTVLGNPVADWINLEVRGAEGHPLQLKLSDVNGRLIHEYQIDEAKTVEHQTLSVQQQPSGLLLLRAISGSQSQSVKVLKP